MHSQIPQIIKGFGFDGAIMRTHFMMYGYNPTFNVPIGQWIGLDGSSIPTIPTYTGEGAEFGKTTVDTWILTRYPSNDARESLDDFRKQFSHIKPLLATRADDSGLRKEDLVKEYEGNNMFQWILLDELMGKYPPATEPMVTQPNDFKVRMPWGYCGNEIWNMSRQAEVSVLTAERLNALAGMYGAPFQEQLLDNAWKNILLSQHHDVQIVGLVPDARKLLPESYWLSNLMIDSDMLFMGDKMSGEGVKQITVFNPLSWKRSAWITTYVSFRAGEAKHMAVKCGDTVLPAHIIYSNTYSSGYILDATIAFNAPLDPLSLTTFSVITLDEPLHNIENKFAVDEQNRIIKTPFYEVKLNPSGGIEYLKNKQNEFLLQNGNGRSAFFEGTIDGVVSQSSGSWTIHKSQRNAPWIRVSENGFIADIPYTFELTLYEDKPVIECVVEFDFNGQMIGLPTQNTRDSHSPFVHDQKLRFKMFPRIEKTATGVRDLPFAIATTMDKTIEGNYWTALTDGHKGWAVFNKGSMAIELEYTVKPFQVQFDNDNLILTALYPQKGNLIARFFNYDDKSTQSVVRIKTDEKI
jgi:alpha-mannosidase